VARRITDDHIGRRSMLSRRTTGRLIDAAKRRLIQQRTVLINQPDQLAAAGNDAATDEAQSEVHAAILTAARSVLADIHGALH
jgi:hypothetical protein